MKYLNNKKYLFLFFFVLLNINIFYFDIIYCVKINIREVVKKNRLNKKRIAIDNIKKVINVLKHVFCFSKEGDISLIEIINDYLNNKENKNILDNVNYDIGYLLDYKLYTKCENKKQNYCDDINNILKNKIFKENDLIKNKISEYFKDNCLNKS